MSDIKKPLTWGDVAGDEYFRVAKYLDTVLGEDGEGGDGLCADVMLAVQLAEGRGRRAARQEILDLLHRNAPTGRVGGRDYLRGFNRARSLITRSRLPLRRPS